MSGFEVEFDERAGWRQTRGVIDAKLRRLRETLAGYGSCLVAYSGGVDSTFLAKVAVETLGGRALAAIADSPSLPRRELAEAIAIAERFKIPLRVVRTAEFDDERYLANPGDRCFFCKHALFDRLQPLAREGGFAVIAYGENFSDLGDHRPGARAAAEFAICAPLKEAGLEKAEIRELSARLGLPTADKPEAACLSSRVMTGERVTPAKLRMIEAAEEVLRALGCRELRVRHHELPPGSGSGAGDRHLARIELGPGEAAFLFAEGRQDLAAAALRALGYAYVTLDVAGYRRGGGNLGPAPLRFATAPIKPPIEGVRSFQA